MFKGVIYISSANRSGSTLLDLLLGEHPEITSLGEVHHLGAYLNKPEYTYYASSDHPQPLTCLCGERISKCKFWSKVDQQLSYNLLHLQLDPYGLHYNFKTNLMMETNFKFVNVVINKTNRKIIIDYFPKLFLNKYIQKITGYASIAHNYFTLYRAASRISKSGYVVDSSKSPYRFQYLFTYSPLEIKIILLCRDPKSVVASMVKRGGNISTAISEWNDTIRRMELFVSNIPKKNILRIRYEDLCKKTEHELKKICDFLELPFAFSMNLSIDGKHHIGGSPSKFKGNRNIVFDESYKNILTIDSIQKIVRQTKKYRTIWGY